MKAIIIFLVGLMLLTGSWGYSFNGDAYDREGKLLWRDRGGERTNRDGHIFERRVRRGDEVYVYDREGRLLRVEKFQ